MLVVLFVACITLVPRGPIILGIRKWVKKDTLSSQYGTNRDATGGRNRQKGRVGGQGNHGNDVLSSCLPYGLNCHGVSLEFMSVVNHGRCSLAREIRLLRQIGTWDTQTIAPMRHKDRSGRHSWISSQNEAKCFDLVQSTNKKKFVISMFFRYFWKPKPDHWMIKSWNGSVNNFPSSSEKIDS